MLLLEAAAAARGLPIGFKPHDPFHAAPAASIRPGSRRRHLPARSSRTAAAGSNRKTLAGQHQDQPGEAALIHARSPHDR